jgi:hypothetical protein
MADAIDPRLLQTKRGERAEEASWKSPHTHSQHSTDACIVAPSLTLTALAIAAAELQATPRQLADSALRRRFDPPLLAAASAGRAVTEAAFLFRFSVACSCTNGGQSLTSLRLE